MQYGLLNLLIFFFSSRRRHTRYWRDWSSDVCSSDLNTFSIQALFKDLRTCTDPVKKYRGTLLYKMAIRMNNDAFKF